MWKKIKKKRKNLKNLKACSAKSELWKKLNYAYEKPKKLRKNLLLPLRNVDKNKRKVSLFSEILNQPTCRSSTFKKKVPTSAHVYWSTTIIADLIVSSVWMDWLILNLGAISGGLDLDFWSIQSKNSIISFILDCFLTLVSSARSWLYVDSFIIKTFIFVLFLVIENWYKKSSSAPWLFLHLVTFWLKKKQNFFS